MTIPNLISSYTERVRIAKLKKAYSVLSNAYNLARSEYGPIEHWDLPQSNDYQNYTIVSSFCQDGSASAVYRIFQTRGSNRSSSTGTDRSHC